MSLNKAAAVQALSNARCISFASPQGSKNSSNREAQILKHPAEIAATVYSALLSLILKVFLLCRDKDIIYRTDRDLDNQADLDSADFDRRLKELDQSSGRAFDDWAPSKRRAGSEEQWRR